MANSCAQMENMTKNRRKCASFFGSPELGIWGIILEFYGKTGKKIQNNVYAGKSFVIVDKL